MWYEKFFNMRYAMHFLNDSARIEYQLGLVKKYVAMERVESVFEIGCGIGLLSNELGKMGCYVEAIDIVKDYIDHAIQKNVKLQNKCSFLCNDIRKYNSDRKFDLVLNMGSSFGYEKTIGENEDIIRKAFGLLNDKGIFLIELFNKEYILENYKEVMEHDFDDCLYRRVSTLNKSRTKLFQKWVVVEENGKEGIYETELHLFGREDIIGGLKKVGFVDVFCERINDRYVFIAKKGT